MRIGKYDGVRVTSDRLLVSIPTALISASIKKEGLGEIAGAEYYPRVVRDTKIGTISRRGANENLAHCVTSIDARVQSESNDVGMQSSVINFLRPSGFSS